ncbi:MAG: OadG family protein, partial [candidate division Zixibacteria bacterium]|nr:OadG family protein [candidate division Zixibacteria bacterium]
MRVVNFLFIALLFGWTSGAFALPKNKAPEPAPETQKPAKTQPVSSTPVVADDDELIRTGYPLNASPAYRYLGPSQTGQAASPYVDVRIGIPETPGGNNHMRRQVALSSNEVVHMVYGVYEVESTALDPALNSLYFYNAYDCNNSNALRNGSLDAPVSDSFPPTDPRPRFVNQGGLFIPPGTAAPVVYGRSFILNPPSQLIARGQATMRDSTECFAMFSMDTTMGNRTAAVAYALNESTWVATYRAGNNPSAIVFNYTTDRGKTWSADQILPTYSPWFNSTEIAGSGNTFYIVSVADPNDPNAFTTTERPVYLKGTYNPLDGSIAFGTMTDITGDFELPGYLANMLDISALMVGDTLHVLWTDWNNYAGWGFPGPGGHVHHAAVLPNGTVQGPHKVTDINIDGRLPDRSYTLFGLGYEVWPMVSLAYDSTKEHLYTLWSAPPDDGNFGWADYEATQSLACYDIFCSASRSNGRSWSPPLNVTQTNNPGCDGSPGDPCHHEDHFEVAAVANDTLWVTAMVQHYPGFQETAVRSGITPDPGPFTEQYDVFRLYKVPAPAPCGGGGDPGGGLSGLPGDTTKFYQIQLQPRGGTKSFNLRLANICYEDTYLDSVTMDAGLNDGHLVVTTNAVPGTLIPVGGSYDFQV